MIQELVDLVFAISGTLITDPTSARFAIEVQAIAVLPY
jgi:hypothetical protein